MDLIINSDGSIKKNVIYFHLMIYFYNQNKAGINHLEKKEKLERMKEKFRREKREKGWDVMLYNGGF